MSNQQNVQIVKDFFAAMGRSDRQAVLALTSENIEWVIPGEGWPLAGTHRGHQGLMALFGLSTQSSEFRTKNRISVFGATSVQHLEKKCPPERLRR